MFYSGISNLTRIQQAFINFNRFLEWKGHFTVFCPLKGLDFDKFGKSCTNLSNLPCIDYNSFDIRRRELSFDTLGFSLLKSRKTGSTEVKIPEYFSRLRELSTPVDCTLLICNPCNIPVFPAWV